MSKSDVKIQSRRLITLAKDRKIILQLDPNWINPDMERVWSQHRKRYQDLPESLEVLIKEVNDWINGMGIS